MSETNKYVIITLVVICFVLGLGWYSSYGTQKVERDKDGRVLKNGQFYDSQEKESGEVWICTGKTSHAYHSTPECYGIQSCRAEKKKITLEEAVSMGRTPCHYCHKDTRSKSVAPQQNLYYLCSVDEDSDDGYYHSDPGCELLYDCYGDIIVVDYFDDRVDEKDPCPECAE